MAIPVITASDVTRCEAITDIIESIALQQTSLSSILNCEADKITKAIELTSSTEELIEVNSSVETMVTAITNLEIVLQSKLSIFKDCICECTTTDVTN